MHRIGVVSAKGGSGRTTLAVLLAHDFTATWIGPTGLPRFDKALHRTFRRYSAMADLLPAVAACSAPEQVVEAVWSQAFGVCRISDVVVIPTRLDPFSLVVLCRETLPLVAASGRPALLYVIDDREGGRPATDRHAREGWETALERCPAVFFAPWLPAGTDEEEESELREDSSLGEAFRSASPVEADAGDYPDADDGCSLYRHLAADGTLLYAGISGDPVFRFRSGHADKSWARQVATVEVEEFPCRWMAREAELVTIALENPLHNIRDRPRLPSAYDVEDDYETLAD